MGEPHDQKHYEAAHESPYTMLIPLAVLAVGSILAGFPFKELFAGHGIHEFFRESVKMNPKIIDEMHHIPAAIAYLPTVMMVVGFFFSWLFYIPQALPAGRTREPASGPVPLPSQQVVLRRAV